MSRQWPSCSPASVRPPSRTARSAMPRSPRPPPGRTAAGRSGSGLARTISSSPAACTVIRSRTGPPRPPCRSALLSPSCTIRYASRDTAPGTPSGSPPATYATGSPHCASRPSSASSPGPDGWSGAPSPLPSRRSSPSTVSSSPTVRRVVSSIAVSAARTNSGSLSRTLRAAPAWRVTALSAWPTESCSSRASRLRTASSAARRSAAASRSSGVGPSRTGARFARSAPAAAAHPVRATSIAIPAKGARARTQVRSRPSGRYSDRGFRRPAKNGSPMTPTANGTSASVIPLMTPPSPTWRVNQAAERTLACRVLAGPSASGRSGGSPHSARATATESGRASGTSAVTAAIGKA